MPWLSPLNLEPSQGFFCCLCGVPDGSPPLHSNNNQCTQVLYHECPANPLQPNSIGIHLALLPCCRQSMTSTSYVVLFLLLALSRRPSHTIVSSNKTKFLVASETSRMYSLRAVVAMCCRNFIWFTRSTESYQSCRVARIPASFMAPVVICGFSPAFKKVICWMVWRACLQLLNTKLMASAIGYRT